MSLIQRIYFVILLCTRFNHIASETIRCQQDEDCRCSQSISGETCTLDCGRAPDTCKESTLTCRSGDPCIIKCDNTATCADEVMINARTATDVTVICSGSDACKTDIYILCGTGDCQLQCLTSKSCLDWGDIDVTLSNSFVCVGAHCPSSLPDEFTMDPTPVPTLSVVSDTPTQTPVNNPTFLPTPRPSNTPTIKPTKPPTIHPETQPTTLPTTEPSPNPTVSPTAEPTQTYFLTIIPSNVTISETEQENMSNAEGDGIDMIYAVIGALIVSVIIICVGMRMRKKRKKLYFEEIDEENNSDQLPNGNDRRMSEVEDVSVQSIAFGVVQSGSVYTAKTSCTEHTIQLKNRVEMVRGDSVSEDMVYDDMDILSIGDTSVRKISEMQTCHLIESGERLSAISSLDV